MREDVVLASHGRALMIGGGAPGLRDVGLLRSALARPRNLIAYRPDADAAELAASYTAGIVRDHPFIDGNKRAGFVVGLMFLDLNGRSSGPPEPLATRAVLDLAAGATDEAGYAALLRSYHAPSAPGT